STIRNRQGTKDRLAYLPPEALEAVAAWVTMRGGEAGALLYPVHRVGRLLPRRLTDQAVLGALHKRASQAGVAPFSPHDFRRTFISELLDAGVDIVTVQQLVGHASPTTTARYDRRGEAAKRQAVALLSRDLGERDR
ncbi:MAG: site-specific integrase, partial [Leptolyngbyaceae cyanobacterium SM1_3_5]|nr:site-specific integrase [Leptolyngbyaceae cyanobacterium SM1_3_5]